MKSRVTLACLSALLGAATVVGLQACGQNAPKPESSMSNSGGSPSDQLHAIMMRTISNMKMCGYAEANPQRGGHAPRLDRR